MTSYCNNCIIIHKRRYWLYGTYPTRLEAYKTAKWLRHKNKSRYFIVTYKRKGRNHEYVNKLYVTKVRRLTWI